MRRLDIETVLFSKSSLYAGRMTTNDVNSP
jgi:hypothetical protein